MRMLRPLMVLGATAWMAGCALFNNQPVAEQGPSAQVERFKNARLLEDRGELDEAEPMYRSIRDISINREPHLAAQAEWRLSFVAESRGDDLKALAHVVSVEKQINHLPEQIARAELPSRKSIFLQRLGREEEARNELKKADKGLQVLMSGLRQKPDEAWLARLYYDMGYSVSDHVREENFPNFLRGLSLSQHYLLKAIAQGDSEWSPRALENLRASYSGFWAMLAEMPLPPGVDVKAAARQKRARQLPLLADFLKVLEQGQFLGPVSNETANPWQKEFEELNGTLQEKTRQILYANSETTALTEESRDLNSLKRAGRIGPAAPKKKDGSKAAADPNL